MSGLESNYDRLPWWKKPKNYAFPSVLVIFALVAIGSTVLEEYHKETEKYNDVISAQQECKNNPPRSEHMRQSCWTANLKASRSPLVVALSSTGIRLLNAGV